jgi:glyoxylase-like metal-dependent hydrolase (beta-lactamase superfamily II)
MNLGKFTINIIETGTFGLDGGAMFGVVPKNLWASKYSQPDEQNRIPMRSRSLLLQFDKKTIVVDTGNGNKFSQKLQSIYAIDSTKESLEISLHNYGVSKEDVTDVLLTHLHFDHAGGATSYDGNLLVPTFANASYYVNEEHLQWAMNPVLKDQASFIKENFVPLLEHGVLKTLTTDTPFEGISFEILHGHTRALQGYKITTSERTIFFPSDLCPTAAHIPLPYGMGYDNFPLSTIEEKKRLWKKAVEEEWIVVFQHDAFIPAGIIGENDKGYFLREQVSFD